jgi:chemotaxis protein methyltransferase CheR
MTADGLIAREREFEFSDEDFRSLRDLVREVSGITLSEAKRELVYGRLSRRLRALGMSTFRDYRALLAGPQGKAELGEFTNAVTTNLTSFFRENHHFDYLREHVLAPMAEGAGRRRRLRIWSAGCSTGEEPYSIAITIAETLPDWQKLDIKILATDLDTDVLSRAASGLYAEDRVRGLGPRRLAKFFAPVAERTRTMYRFDPQLAGLVSFRQLNLMNPLPMRGPLDVIFCRNVIIYFDKDTQRELFARIAPLQSQDALLFLGHSENIFKVSEAYDLIGKTVYRRNQGR